ncbi:MAG: right-handed parallel beta-helix repeat-containing protein [bacterium]|nr:right-handed parallel beta-helix repeat-containing protein [bacterium]
MIKYTWNKCIALTAVVTPLIVVFCGAAPVHYVNLLNAGHDVPPYTNWATAALSIGDALAVTTSGSMVRVAAGTYLPTGSLTITNPNVRVESVSGARSTIVCGNGLFSLFTLMAPGAALCGFTLTNGGGSSAGGVLAAAASTVERCIVTGNNVLGDGGGLFANSVAALQVSDCMIVGNSADRGGGVYLQNAAAFVRNSICAFNSAPGKGAGIYAEKAMIDNCSVVSNTGQGVYLLQARVLNSIAYHNSAENIAGLSMALTNVCTIPDPGAGGAGVVTNNPCFVSVVGDFRLLCASPCIDRGTPADWMTTAVDQYSSPRVSGAAPDIGAAEFPYPYLDITSHVSIASGPTNWVSFDVAALLLSGTNRYSITTNLYTNALTTNLVVVGEMWAVNAALGATGVFPAALGWHAPEIPLQIGANAILVYGTNDVDGITNDILIVTRGANGTGTPCIDITNEAAARVNFDVTSYTIGGTNWQIAGGTLWWSNTLAAGATQFSASGVNGAFSPLINKMARSAR